MTIRTPNWVKNTVFYEIFLDRFAIGGEVGHGLVEPSSFSAWDVEPSNTCYTGGNLQGVIEKLDYLAGIGVGALYLTPVFQSPSNHRYHVESYYEIDVLLGGNEALDSLISEAHKRSMRLILDGVFNHVGRTFFAFSDVLAHESCSPYLDWFQIKNWPLSPYDEGKPANYACWHGHRELPILNHHNPRVREYLMKVGEYWIERGVDGWRLDAAYCIDASGFWHEFRQRVKALNPDAYLVGEVIDNAKRWLDGSQFDGVTNYPFRLPTLFFAAGRNVDERFLDNTDVGYMRPLPLDASRYAKLMNKLLNTYPREIQLTQLNILGTHDTARSINVVGGDQYSQKLAAMLLMTMPGAPCIYYGDEVGLRGGSDPDCRRGFPEEKNWDTGLASFYKQLLYLRRSHISLRLGQLDFCHAEAFVIVYCRFFKGTTVLVAVNAGQEPVTVKLGQVVRRCELDIRVNEFQWNVLVSTCEMIAPDASDEYLIRLPGRNGVVLG